MRLLLALALIGAAAGARAASDSDADDVEIVEYNTEVQTSFTSPAPVVSADGYHFTAVVVSKDSERLYVDDKKVAQGEPGAFTRAEEGALGRTFQGALIRDGKVAAHAVLSRDKQGRPGYRLAINGVPAGRRFEDIRAVAVSPGGANVALVGMTGKDKFVVVSAQGDSPTVDSPQQLFGLSDSGLVYGLAFGGRRWLYRNHKALPYAEYADVAVAPDLSRIAGLLPWTDRAPVEIDGKELGRWKDVRSMRYTAAGDLIFLARTGRNVGDAQVNTVVFNGREALLPAFTPARHYPPSVRPSDGVSFLIEEAGTYGMLLIAGRPMPELGEIMPAAEWVGFSPSGRHWAAVVSKDKGTAIALDGKITARAPRPLKNARIIFDSETEFHYLADPMMRVALVCGSIGGPVSPRSACARNGAAMGAKDRYQLKALEAIEAAPAR